MKIPRRRAILMALLLVTLFVTVGYVLDLVKLARCDFGPDETHKAEILYGIGAVVPPVGAFMGWFVNAQDSEKRERRSGVIR